MNKLDILRAKIKNDELTAEDAEWMLETIERLLKIVDELQPKTFYDSEGCGWQR